MPEPGKKYWIMWYAGVILFLLTEILFFAWLTKLYA